MAQWVDLEALEKITRLSHDFLTLWVRSVYSVVSNQPQEGWSRIDMRSVRDFLAFISAH